MPAEKRTLGSLIAQADQREAFRSPEQFLESVLESAQAWFYVRNRPFGQEVYDQLISDWSEYGPAYIRKAFLLSGDEKALALILDRRIRMANLQLPSWGLEFAVVRPKPRPFNFQTPDEVTRDLLKIVQQGGIYRGEFYADPLSGRVQLLAAFNRPKYGGLDLFQSQQGHQALTEPMHHSSVSVIKRTVTAFPSPNI